MPAVLNYLIIMTVDRWNYLIENKHYITKERKKTVLKCFKIQSLGK